MATPKKRKKHTSAAVRRIRAEDDAKAITTASGLASLRSEWESEFPAVADGSVGSVVIVQPNGDITQRGNVIASFGSVDAASAALDQARFYPKNGGVFGDMKYVAVADVAKWEKRIEQESGESTRSWDESNLMDALLLGRDSLLSAIAASPKEVPIAAPIEVVDSAGVSEVMIPPPQAAQQAENAQVAVVVVATPQKKNIFGQITQKARAPRTKRFSIPARGKSGMRPFHAPSLEYVGALLLGTKKGRRYLELELAIGLLSGAEGVSTKTQYAQWQKSQKAVQDGYGKASDAAVLIATYKRWIAKNKAQSLALESAAVDALKAESIRTSIHPMDLIEISNLLRQSPDVWVPWSKSLRANGITLNAYHLKMLGAVGKIMSSLQGRISAGGAVGGLTVTKNVHPWHARQSGRCIGAEVVEIVYEVPSAWGADGKPTAWTELRHRTAAAQAWDAASSAAEYQALLDRTPAGRTWLYSDGDGVALATDRHPRTPIFALNKQDKFLAALAGLSGSTVTGLLV